MRRHFYLALRDHTAQKCLRNTISILQSASVLIKPFWQIHMLQKAVNWEKQKLTRPICSRNLTCLMMKQLRLYKGIFYKLYNGIFYKFTKKPFDYWTRICKRLNFCSKFYQLHQQLIIQDLAKRIFIRLRYAI